MLSFTIIPDAAYALFLISEDGKTKTMHGIVPGSDIAGILQRSTSPASLRFERVQ